LKIEISRYLDTRYKSKNNTYPVSIRIYHNRKYDYVKTGIYLTEIEYEELHSSKIKSALKEVLKSIVKVETLITSYLNSSSAYDIKKIRAYISELPNANIIQDNSFDTQTDNIFDWFDKKIDSLRSNSQFGSAECYTSTKNVYMDYLKVSNAPFNFFSIKKLKDMEVKMMEERGIEISTVGKHARNLRAIFKMALSEEFITNKEYPFGRYKYVIPEVTQAKKSLSRKMMADLMNYEPANYFERRAISYFKFSYFGNGMNLKDMAYLKFKDWKNDVISYSRKKTKNTTNRLKTIRVIVIEEMKSVISEFGNPISFPDSYIFPIIESGMDAEKVNTRVHTRSKSINKTLENICKKLDFNHKVTLGMARHSFANALKQEGAGISFIQESLGHGSASTTEHYMNSFEVAISNKHIKKLKNYFK